MYDSYPDKIAIRQMVNRIYDRLVLENETREICQSYPDEKWLKDTILLMLLMEMFKRRKNRRDVTLLLYKNPNNQIR